MIGRLLMVVLVVLGVRSVCLGSGSGEADGAAAAIFERANAAFAEGASLRDEDEAKARARLDEAIAGYRTLIEDKGISNAKLHYNLGNAFMMRDELGRAIAAYRRAAELAPNDENLRANLVFASSRVETSFEVDEASRLYSTLLGWQDSISIRGRLGVFVALFSLAWIAGLSRLFLGGGGGGGRGGMPRWLMPTLLALSMIPAISLALSAYGESGVDGVVVAESVAGLKGPDESYEESFTRPLTEGVEFGVLEERPGWVYVRLADGRTTWLARGVVEFI